MDISGSGGYPCRFRRNCTLNNQTRPDQDWRALTIGGSGLTFYD
jgi:hypothetical protein